MTNAPLTDQRLFPNHMLRSEIQAWLQKPDNARLAEPLRNRDARPLDASQASPSAADQPHSEAAGRADTGKLSDIVRYTGQTKRYVERVTTVYGEGIVYRLRYDAATRETYISCSLDNFVTEVETDGPCAFVTPNGIGFYDPASMLPLSEATDDSVPGSNTQGPCKFGNRCTNVRCNASHQFACHFGVTCRSQLGDKAACKFLHPTPDTVVPQGAEYPLSVACKYGTSCTNKACHFAHPWGRLRVARRQRRFFCTHSLTLELLDEPFELRFTPASTATRVQFQGEYIFCFTPYPGLWAKEHMRTVEMHRYDVHQARYLRVGEWSLDRHYVNCAVGVGRYLVISFWPYEDEAMRTLWEGLARERELEKQNRKLQKQNEAQQQKLQASQAQLDEKMRLLSVREQQLNSLRRSAAKSARQAAVTKSFLERQLRFEERRRQSAEQRAKRDGAELNRLRRLKAERQRNERFRLRDPIHLLVCEDGASGMCKDDWRLVLDYHKGAHNLQVVLADSTTGDKQDRLLITENDVTFAFELAVPRNLRALGGLPVQPGRLCDEF